MGIRQHQASPSPSIAQRVLEPAGHVKMAVVEPVDLPRWLATSGTYPLGVVSFGSPLPVPVPCPVVHLDLPHWDGPPQCGWWTSGSPFASIGQETFLRP